MIVLDTNVISEFMRPAPEEGVERWLAAQPAASVFTTTVTQAEILHGVALLAEGRRKAELDVAIAEMFRQDLAERVLPFDGAAARAFATIAADRRRVGRPISQFDAQIAAICFSRGASLATRNVADFDGCGIVAINPWCEQ